MDYFKKVVDWLRVLAAAVFLATAALIGALCSYLQARELP